MNLVVEGAKLRLPGAVASGPAIELSRSTVRGHIDKWAAHYGISVSLARALAWQESGFQTNVTSSTGAWGPMQIMPATWSFVETVLLGRTVPRTGEGGVEVGMTLLNHLLKRFGGDQRLALAAWYQGEKAVREHGVYAEIEGVRRERARAGRPAALARERGDRGMGAAGRLADVERPERRGIVRDPEDLDVPGTVPAGVAEHVQQLPDPATPSPGRARSSRPSPCQSATWTPVIRPTFSRQVTIDLRRVPEVPEVDHDPDVRQAGLVEQIQRLRESS